MADKEPKIVQVIDVAESNWGCGDSPKVKRISREKYAERKAYEDRDRGRA